MAITVEGVTGSVNDQNWAQLWQDGMNGLRQEYVPVGMQVSPSTGRVLAVSAGRSFQVGTNAIYTGGSTVTIAANTASAARIDTVCIQVNWSGTEATAGSFVVVQGVAAANPVPRGLTKTPGGVWQTPLAYVTVAAGAASISAASIVDARPRVSLDFVPLVIPSIASGTWTQPTSTKLGVQRAGDWVYLTGRLQFTASNQAIGSNLVFGGVPVVPDGYRPIRDEVSAAFGSPGGGNVNELIVHPDGTLDLWVCTGTLATNSVLRFTSISWIGA